MSTEPENRDRDLLMDLQETRGDVQVARRPARGAGTLSKGSGFFLLYLHPCVDSTRSMFGEICTTRPRWVSSIAKYFLPLSCRASGVYW